ncbi:hypothetical protein EB796_006710 [Bugula neritina]|uniref:Uncharacterized protein n=1 Tax=Bugula neritina TaxID=10212 RepID=A0A7J7KBJ7_BUGNE|nr:hypothetical protein EB796_006710 [Bugula neritina]
MFCTSCLLFICYKCSKKTKCAKTGASHTTEDYEESLVQKYKTKYANWKAQKEKDIQTLKSKQDKLVADIQRGVSNLSADNMEQVLEKANRQKTECQKVRKRLAEERMVLSEYSKDIGKVGDKQFIILVSQVCGDSQDGVTNIEHSLDTECSVVMSQSCYDVTDWEGKMLVGRNDGFDVVDSRVSPDTSERGGQSRLHRVLKSVSIADSGHIISIQCYNNQIYTLCKEKPLVQRDKL